MKGLKREIRETDAKDRERHFSFPDLSRNFACFAFENKKRRSGVDADFRLAKTRASAPICDLKPEI
jgi:hypothetical protein